MITRIEALNYRCLRHVAQDLGPFHVLVGPNGSGKSTFLDIPALMRDIVRDGRNNIGDVISSRAPNYTDLLWMRTGRGFELAIEAEVPESRRSHLPGGEKVCRYNLGIGHMGNSGELGIFQEMLSLWPALTPFQRLSHPGSLGLPDDRSESNMVVQKYFDGKDYFWHESDRHRLAVYKFGHRRSALANLPEDETLFPVATWFRQFLLTGVQTIALNGEAMRRPSPPNARRSFLADGSSLPWLIDQLPPKSREQWLSHVKTELPNLTGIRTIDRPEDRHRYLMLEYDSGLEVPSWVVADGTLHMLALTLLAYLPDTTATYLIEEPENCIHPTAIEAVFESLASVYDGQVLLATHSPVIVGLADLDQVLCFTRTQEGVTIITPGNEHRILKNWRGEVSLSVLFASGVFG